MEQYFWCAYNYDQLNRIKSVDSRKKVSLPTWQWENAGVASSLIGETFSYDLNGNITDATRRMPQQVGNNYQSTPMDALAYAYNTSNNRLTHVDDDAAYNNLTDWDFDDMGSNQAFAYDLSGHLISDPQQGMSIFWYSFDKLKSVTKTQPDANGVLSAQYRYDALHNRVQKTIVKNNQSATKEFYIRDAQGNTLAVYEFFDNKLVWKEQHLYSSPIGLTVLAFLPKSQCADN